VGACGTSCGASTVEHPRDLTPLLGIVLGALALLALMWAAWARGRRLTPQHRWGRHIALNLPLLAPERYCACGRCEQLAAPGSWLADWHYDVPGVLPPTEAPDAIPIRGLAWTYGPRGWEPAIVYVVAPTHPLAPTPPRPRPAHPQGATNGQATNGQVRGKIPSL
jgi:hypothetical protein